MATEFGKLYHPIIGVMEYPMEQCQNIMANPPHKRGGWEWYDDGQDGIGKSNDDGDHNTGNKKGTPRKRGGKP